MRDLAGKTAVITGAASGIGRAIAAACARQGMRVVLADVDLEGARETAALVKALGAESLPVQADVSVASDVDRLADAAFAFGPVALLVNNAGVMVAGPVWETPIADWQWMLGVNLMGVVHGVRSFVPRMLAQGSEGHVVNTASLAGLVSTPGLGAYSAGKHAVVALSECLAHDLRLADARIGVSVLCPGFVHTRLGDAARHRVQAAGPPTPAQTVAGHRVDQLLETATITADEIADSAIDAVQRGRFYVLTHPGSGRAVEQRARAIRDRGDPAPARL